MSERKATVSRDTLETRITVSVNLDGSGAGVFDTGIPFLEHMLDQVARHGMIDLDIKATGDTHIDDHHTVEDIGITLGQAVAQAVGGVRACRFRAEDRARFALRRRSAVRARRTRLFHSA